MFIICIGRANLMTLRTVCAFRSSVSTSWSTKNWNRISLRWTRCHHSKRTVHLTTKSSMVWSMTASSYLIWVWSAAIELRTQRSRNCNGVYLRATRTNYRPRTKIMTAPPRRRRHKRNKKARIRESVSAGCQLMANKTVMSANLRNSPNPAPIIKQVHLSNQLNPLQSESSRKVSEPPNNRTQAKGLTIKSIFAPWLNSPNNNWS